MESGQETNSKKEIVARNLSSLMSPATQLKNEDPLAQPLSTVYVWPIILFLLAMLAFDLCSIPLISSLISARATQVYYMSLASGVLSGQACFVTILAGLWSKDWLVGLVVASSLSGLGVFLMFLGTYFDFLNPTTNVSLFVGPEQGGFWGFFMIPLIAMGAALPFYGLRYWFGWHLTRKNEGPTQSTGGIEGLLIATAIVAAVLFVARVPLVAWETQSAQFWPAIFMGIAWLTFLSVVALIPATWISFRIEPSGRKLAFQFGLVVVFVIGVLGLSVLFQSANRGGGPQFVEMFAYTVLTVGIAASVVFAGLWALIFSGYRLAKLNNRSKPGARVRKPQSDVLAVPDTDSSIVGVVPELAHAGSNPESFDNVVSDASQNRPSATTPIGVKRHRRIAAVVFCLALLSSVAVARIESQRKNTIERQYEMANELAKGGGSIVVQQRKVTNLVVGRNATNESLTEFLHLSDVETLSLAGSQITDEAIEQLSNLPNLTVLDLSNTEVTSAVVPKLVKLLQLQDLSVASTNLNVDDVKRLLSTALLHLHSIDISNLSLAQADLQRLAPWLPPSFSIRGYGLDDFAMQDLLQSALQQGISRRYRNGILPSLTGRKVDLSDNPINGSCLDGSPVLFRELRLSNTVVSDAVFGPILRRLKVERLCLANTPLTDAILKDMAASPNLTSLELGNGQITEAGLAKSRLMLLSSLALNSQQFTGVCFKSWQPSLQSLDMSGSGLNDETVAHLQNLGWVRFNLSNTEITDAALPALAKALSLEVDLSHTKISADGLMNGDLQNFTRVIVAAGQFTPDEIARIKSVIQLLVGEKSRS